MCEIEHAPFEKPLHDIYEKNYVYLPFHLLAIHFTNVNSIFGLSPNRIGKKFGMKMKIKEGIESSCIQTFRCSKI